MPFLKLEFVSESETPYTRPDSVQRTYRYLAKPVEHAHAGTFTGEVEVVPPWDEAPHHIPAYGRSRSNLSVAPSMLSLYLEGPTDDRAEATLVVTTKDPNTDTSVSDVGGHDDVLVATRKQTSVPGGRFAQYAIRLKRGRQVAQGLRQLVVRTRERDTESVIVPVWVTVGTPR